MNASDDWYNVSQLTDKSYRIHEAQMYGMYLIEGTEQSILIDTGVGVGNLRSLVTELVDTPITVALTHTHWDHIGAADQFENVLVSSTELPEDRQVAIDSLTDEFTHRPKEFAHRWTAENRFPDNKSPENYTIQPFKASFVPIEDGISLGDRSLEVYPLPGHSPGHLGFLDPKTNIFYGGDIIHSGRGLSILFEDCSINDYIESLTILKNLYEAGAFDTLVTSHNEPLTGADLSLINELLVALRKIAAGDLEYEIVETTWGRARSYQVGSSKIITKMDTKENEQ